MKLGTFLVGLLILIGGSIAFTVGSQQVEEGQDLRGEISRAISSEAQQDYQVARAMKMGGLVGIALGSIVSLVGLLGKSQSQVSAEDKTSKSWKSSSDDSQDNEEDSSSEDSEKIYCPNCGEKINSDSTFCPECGEEVDT